MIKAINSAAEHRVPGASKGRHGLRRRARANDCHGHGCVYTTDGVLSHGRMCWKTRRTMMSRSFGQMQFDATKWSTSSVLNWPPLLLRVLWIQHSLSRLFAKLAELEQRPVPVREDGDDPPVGGSATSSASRQPPLTLAFLEAWRHHYQDLERVPSLCKRPRRRWRSGRC